METVTKRLYEGMFLVDSGQAASDWEGINAAIKTVLERADAEIVSIRKWNECKLAYEIDHKERGTYLLCYFRAEGEKISGLERDVQLSEQIMRVLVLNAEHMSAEDIEKDTPAICAEKLQAKAAEAAEAAKAAKAAEAAQAAEAAEAAQAAKELEQQSQPEQPATDDAEGATEQADTEAPIVDIIKTDIDEEVVADDVVAEEVVADEEVVEEKTEEDESEV